MARYIRIASKDDTDVLIDIEKIQYVQKKEDGCVIGLFNRHLTSSADFDEVVNALNENANSEIEDAPTTDVAEVRHGKWIDRDGKTWCSLCQASNKQYKPPYCPHCGAKMDKGVTND